MKEQLPLFLPTTIRRAQEVPENECLKCPFASWNHTTELLGYLQMETTPYGGIEVILICLKDLFKEYPFLLKKLKQRGLL